MVITQESPAIEAQFECLDVRKETESSTGRASGDTGMLESRCVITFFFLA